jgi:glycosyltransferase involved in cell wall biosynthesis
MNSTPRILYISSANFSEGPGAIGWTHVFNMRKSGLDVDVLTLYRQEEHPDFMYVKEGISFYDRLKNKLKSILGLRKTDAPYVFFYKKETAPPVSVKKILSKINKPYDLVIIYFWQELLSFYTVESIFDKLNKPVVFFISPDYSHMSGGCHFSVDCERYKTGCGCCPAWKSNNPNDFTHWNVEYRKRFYEKVRPVVYGNSYMISFYKKSFLLNNARIETTVSGFDSEKFHPIDKKVLIDKYHIPSPYSFIVGFGCQQLNNPRKGVDYLIEALNIWYKSLSESEVNRVLIMAVGEHFDTIKSKIPFKSYGLGLIPFNELSEFYSLADVFVCSSVDDAGPSMVLQSISCGTPVVGFEMGAVIDHVKDKGTGYCAKLRDSHDLAHGIDSFFKMTEDSRKAISDKCRNMVLTECSYSNKINSWLDIYRKYKG